MRTTKQTMHLGAFLVHPRAHIKPSGYTHTDAQHIEPFKLYEHLAYSAEQGKLDFIYLADSQAPSPEPLTFLSYLAGITTRIGLAAAVSTTYYEPFNLAREFCCLDHLSGGRAAWKVITSGSEAEAHHFNQDHPPALQQRQNQAQEFLDVAYSLWDSWEDNAILANKESGIFADPTKVHELNHRGEFFAVRGPLNLPRSPQGRPVILQDADSEAGTLFAAETAEVVFTTSQTLEDAQHFYQKIKSLATAHGRSADQIKVMAGIYPAVGISEEEALQTFAHLPLTNASSHRLVYGSPSQIADQLEEWFAKEACDGFVITPPNSAGGLEDFVQNVIPELQIRGLFRYEYEGTTLREHLGLSRPQSRFQAARASSEVLHSKEVQDGKIK
ncbi:NtaA/DmoA family FMN-dependent monooxygenase [Paenibacillus alba]|uniref:NtaA/DmoA family FMN-dependent monooxygenase n=1 Tax=Paenibacillus alba TaxID=1197127 RepID=UPI00156651F2|nr:NtaA/DmoA family FMN-dependent monooxygenase [Paenibacillus alba]NQX67482.1 NtaA/DmoA family FMN-dependent monooxygenase [Paenibacillus alba]